MRNTERFVIKEHHAWPDKVARTVILDYCSMLQAATKGRSFVQCSCPAMLLLLSFTGDILKHICATSNQQQLNNAAFRLGMSFVQNAQFLDCISVKRIKNCNIFEQKILLLKRQINKARCILGKSLLSVWFPVLNCQCLRSKGFLVSFSTQNLEMLIRFFREL